ncbi:hypothetical protein Tco_0398771, partial [Tanacetum coccineum]
WKRWPMREMAKQRRSFSLESNLKTRFSLKGSGIRGLLDSFSCSIKVLSWCNPLGYAVTDIIMAECPELVTP